MKAYLRTLIAPAQTNLVAVHLVREYLQARILQSLQRAGAMQTLAFHGGTSLRFLYDLPRYSEDLDFALELHPEAYDFRAYLQQIMRDFSTEAYAVDIKLNEKRVVHKAFVRFRGLLHELGLSGHAEEVLAIKIEVDTDPPLHAGLMTTPTNKYVLINLQHHDPATLLAGKLSAILQRDYLKGRDIYDLWWYLNQPNWPVPNLEYLNQSLQQGGWADDLLTPGNWQMIVREQMLSLKWSLVMEDVGSFVIDSYEQADFRQERLLALLD
ncbi:MAG: nucleotidyl transferase AbiEii/AbiGii toxin family protein [Ardenticatenaceae bacterium]|nr:nucleotidyl transferase AbiEii/AbiGii toxin family protein [Ardenticatenaceae bacterium]